MVEEFPLATEDWRLSTGQTYKHPRTGARGRFGAPHARSKAGLVLRGVLGGEPSDANEALPHRHRRSPRHKPRNAPAWAAGRRSESQSPAVQAGPRRKSFGSRSSPYQGEQRQL